MKADLTELIFKTDEELSSYLEYVEVEEFRSDLREALAKKLDKIIIEQTIEKLKELIK